LDTGWRTPQAILVFNAGSSTLEFRLFGNPAGGEHPALASEPAAEREDRSSVPGAVAVYVVSGNEEPLIGRDTRARLGM
jgi:acetate kinase